MKPVADDWHGVAIGKLTKVMGSAAGQALAESVLNEIGIAKLTSAKDLHRFAGALSHRGGFAAAVGALLGLHATMYDDNPSSNI